jgi:hypothetical protein
MIRFTSVLILIFVFVSMEAQYAVNVSGAYIVSNNGSVSFSVGQVACKTLSDTRGSVSEGVQQPFEIFISQAIKEAKGINLSVMVYPNPITDYLTLKIDEFDISNLYYQLFDINGVLLQNVKIIGNQTIIPMSNFVPAIYIVKVIHGKKEVKMFKIIKN